MSPEKALARIEKLVALAGPASGAAEEERRSAAVQVVRLMLEHGLAPSSASVTRASAIDLDEVAALALHAAQLEQTLASERAAHAAEIRRRDEQWRRLVQDVRKEDQAETRRAVKKAAKRGAVQEREGQARAGGRARDRALTREQKAEIGRQGARERWRRWRERHGGDHDGAVERPR